VSIVAQLVGGARLAQAGVAEKRLAPSLSTQKITLPVHYFYVTFHRYWTKVQYTDLQGFC